MQSGSRQEKRGHLVVYEGMLVEFEIDFRRPISTVVHGYAITLQTIDVDTLVTDSLYGYISYRLFMWIYWLQLIIWIY